MSNPHDHTICYMHDFITQSEVVSALTQEASNWNSHSETLISLGLKDEAYERNFTALGFLDGRKGYVDKFTHCPYCGEKIDWVAIKNDFRGLP